MAKFDVYPMPDAEGYLLDVQADILSALNTRVVVPLLPLETAPEPAKRLNPVFQISGHDYVMMTQFMAAVPVAALKSPVAELSAEFDKITNALDMAFYGF